MILTNIKIPQKIGAKTLGDFYQIKKQHLNLNNTNNISTSLPKVYAWGENQYKSIVKLNKNNAKQEKISKFNSKW